MTIDGIECYEENGTAYLKLETVARGLGFTETKGDKEYVMWRRVDGYLADLGFGTSAERPQFIPENIFYRLAMKAKNEAAEKFQAKVADEIIPSIRKHGGYIVGQEDLSEDDLLARAYIIAQKKIQEREKRIAFLNQEMDTQRKTIEQMQPKVSYYDLILQCPDLISTTTIAKDYGMSAKKFNSLLHEYGIQFKQNDVWVLYAKYQANGYLKTKTHNYVDENGNIHSKEHTYWTQKGRLFLYDYLKEKDILPLIESQSA